MELILLLLEKRFKGGTGRMKPKLLFLVVSIFYFLNLSAEDNYLNKIRQNPLPYHFSSFAEYLLNGNYSRDFQTTDPPTGTVRQTAEFEQMEGVLVVYPLGIPVSAIAEMSEDAKVYTIVTSSSQTSCQNAYQNAGVNLANCEFINAGTDTYWVRDFGPWFISNDNQIEIVDFPYNRPRPLDDEIPVIVANYLGINYYGMNVEHTGGNYMCDGNFVGASTDLVYDENPGLTSAQIADYFQSYLGIDTYHVTIDPLDDYIKHIDCWGKFLDVDKVLIGQVPETDYRYEDYEFVADYFADQISAWGNHYQVYRVYTPGGNIATPYTNSLILNKKVFLPVSGSQWDDEAIASYEEAMPGYEIIPVSSYGWYDTDALHCRTRGVADREMLYISHSPLLGEQDYQEEYVIQSDIIPYSGANVYTDSLIVYYQIDGGDFIPVVMTNVSGNTYSAVIPGQEEGTEICYYIHAADASGKSADHPFIGAADPHDFVVVNAPEPAELVVDPVTVNLVLPQNQSDFTILELSNIGGMSLSYTLNESAEWLTLDPLSGTIEGGDTDEITLSFDTNGMAAGDYTCNITINDDREVTTVPVNLTVTAVNNDGNLPGNVPALNNYPNPFNPCTTISFELPHNSRIELSIKNIKGQKIRTLVRGEKIAGKHQILWNGTDTLGNQVSSGVYFVYMDVHDDLTDYISVKKVVMLK